MRKYFIIFILVIEIILVSLLIYVGVVYKNKKIISIAHRGETSRIIENTLPALEEAVKDSYNGIEIDVRRTSDGVIVLNHDKKISGTINGEVYTYNISKTPYEKLREIILMYDSEYGKIHIATLAEALKYAHDNNIELAIHCKIQDDDFLLQVAQMVVDYGMSGKCMYNVVNDYENHIRVITSIDKNAKFHITYNYLLTEDNNIFDLLKGNQIVITIKADLLTEQIFKKIRETGGIFYAYSVDKYSFNKVSKYKPDYIEYSDGVRISEIKN